MFCYFLTFIFPRKFAWLFPTMDAYNIQIGFLWIISAAQCIFLIWKLRSFKNMDKAVRSEWTLLLLWFNLIANLIFIWKKHDEFEKKNFE